MMDSHHLSSLTLASLISSILLSSSSLSSPVPYTAVQFFILFSTAREKRGVSARAACGVHAEAE